MRFICYVILPTCFQLIIGAAVMFSNKPGGEFVGLGVMLIGMVAIPLTAIINWSRLNSKPSLTTTMLINRTFYTSSVFPTLCLALYLLAS